MSIFGCLKAELLLEIKIKVRKIQNQFKLRYKKDLQKRHEI